jgi:hypothetical protein
MRTYQESDLFRNALAHHLAQTGNENHSRTGMWLAHHTQAVPRILRLLTLLEPQLPHPLTELQVLDLGAPPERPVRKAQNHPNGLLQNVILSSIIDIVKKLL